MDQMGITRRWVLCQRSHAELDSDGQIVGIYEAKIWYQVYSKSTYQF